MTRLFLRTHRESEGDGCEYAIVDLDGQLARRILDLRRRLEALRAAEETFVEGVLLDAAARYLDATELADDFFDEGTWVDHLHDHGWAWLSDEVRVPAARARTEGETLRVRRDGIAWSATPRHLDVTVETPEIPFAVFEAAAGESASAEASRAVYCCSACGCTDVEGQYWVALNDPGLGRPEGAVTPLGEASPDVWCPECQAHDDAACLVDRSTGRCAFHPDQEHPFVPHPFAPKETGATEAPGVDGPETEPRCAKCGRPLDDEGECRGGCERPCMDCDGRGWLHMRSTDDGPLDHVERCDSCARYPDDESAIEAHRGNCGCKLGSQAW